VSAGFCMAPLALTDGPDRVAYCNVRPREDETDLRKPTKANGSSPAAP
jgi:hypothetical protein